MGSLDLAPDATAAAAAPAQPQVARTAVKSPTRQALGRLVRKPGALIAITYLVLLLLVAIFGPTLAPYAYDERAGRPFLTPSGDNWLGTDDLGRDNFSRLVYATRLSLVTSVSVVALAALIAIPVGLIAGYRGGRLDSLLMRLTDAGLAFPPVVLALAVAGVLGPGVRNTVLALSIVFVPGLIRLVRGQVLAVREETFIEASLAAGTRERRILMKRVFPNVRSPLVVQISLLLAAALLAEAGLSYLGLGAIPPKPTWGNMLRRAYDSSLFTQQWQLFAPGAVIAATVFAFNALGDGLRDAFSSDRSGKTRRNERRGLTTVERADGARTDAATPTAAPDTLLSIERLSVEFRSPQGYVKVVDDLDLTIRRGEILGLVGESGSGKTVTSLATMRLIPSPPGRITSGRIMFEGRDILDMSFRDMRALRGPEISMIFQDPMTSLNPAFTIGDQLVEAQRLHHPVKTAAARERARELLDLVGIPAPGQRLDEYPHQLSGGMRQRAMIAVALANQPKLLIADEPTTALDVTVQAQILDLLRSLRSEFEMAILFVTHDLGVVADLCDRVAVMYAGQVVEVQDVHGLFAAPRHPYTMGLLAAMPQVGQDGDHLAVIPGQVPLPHEFALGCRFHARCPFATDECVAAPVALLDRHDTGGLVRCIRTDIEHFEGASR